MDDEWRMYKPVNGYCVYDCPAGYEQVKRPRKLPGMIMQEIKGSRNGLLQIIRRESKNIVKYAMDRVRRNAREKRSVFHIILAISLLT